MKFYLYKNRFALFFWSIALVLRGVFLWINFDTLTEIPNAGDSFGYYERGVNLTHFGQYTFPEKDAEVAFWTPGYPLLMYALFSIFGTSLASILVLQLFLGVATLWLIYCWISDYYKTTYQKPLPHICVVILLLFPDFLLYDFQVLTQCLFNTLLLIVVYLFHKNWWQKKWTYTLFTGACLGYAILTKSVATFVLPLLWIWVVLYAQKAWKSALLCTLVCILCVLPWSIRNYTLLHTWVWVHTNTQWNFYLGNHQQSVGSYGGKSSYRYDHGFLHGYSETQREEICKQRAWVYLKKHPQQALSNNLQKLSRTFSPRGAWVVYQSGYTQTGSDFSAYSLRPSPRFWQIWSLPFLFLTQSLGLIGIVLSLRKLKQHYWLVGIYGAFLATFILFLTGTNYVYLSLPYLVVLAFLGGIWVWKEKCIVWLLVSSGLILLNWMYQYLTF